MCLIFTLIAAAVVSDLWYLFGRNNHLHLGTLALMLWGAGLMWCVDGVFSVLEGEPFFDLSGSDALLGLLILACALAAWGLILLVKRPRTRTA